MGLLKNFMDQVHHMSTECAHWYLDAFYTQIRVKNTKYDCIKILEISISSTRLQRILDCRFFDLVQKLKSENDGNRK